MDCAEIVIPDFDPEDKYSGVRAPGRSHRQDTLEAPDDAISR